MKNKHAKAVFDLKIPPPIENRRWSEFEESFVPNQDRLNSHNRMLKMIWEALNLKAGAKVLEIGGGLGFMSLELANKGVNCTDLDIVKENVELVNHCAKHFQLPLKAIHGDSCQLPFGDGEFDAVFSVNVFEHIRDQQAALDEQARVLHKGGRLLISDGNFLNPIVVFNLIFIRPWTSRGRQGGLRWLFTKGKVHENYGMGWPGKDEDVKTLWWWHRNINRRSCLKPITITTSKSYFNPNKLVYRFLKLIAGGIVVIAEKVP